MARKRRAPSPPPPPPPPPQQSSSSEESGSDTEEEEEVSPRATAAQMPPQKPQPRAPAAAANDADSSSSEKESDQEADAQASQMQAAAATPAAQPESDADEEEEKVGDTDESESEIPEPVKKAAATTSKSKTVKPQVKKRPVPEPAPSGNAKKAKAQAGKVAPEATPAGKVKKAKADLEKAAPVQTSSGKVKKPGGKLEKPGLDSSPASQSARSRRLWSKDDVIKILEALAGHVKRDRVLPMTEVLYAAVRDHLDRKNCTYTDLYEKVRGLKKRFRKMVSRGVVPSGEDELGIHNLSDAIWGEKAKEAIAAVAASRHDDSTVRKSKNHQSRTEKVDGNSKVGTLKEATRDTQKASKQQGNGKGLGKDAKSGTPKETATTATQNGGGLTTRNRGKMHKDNMDVDLMPKDVSNDNQNDGTWTEEETQEETEKGASLQRTLRSFDEMQKLYPNLTWWVETIGAQHPCRDTLMRGFRLIDDDKANALESKIRLQRLSCFKEEICAADLTKGVVNMLIGLMD